MDSNNRENNLSGGLSPNPDAFAELKKLVQEELGETAGPTDKAFEPVTEGLGLDYQPSEEPVEKKAQVNRIKEKVAALHNSIEEEPEMQVKEEIEVLPPPGRAPSLWRRVMAGVVDQAFVTTLWLLAMVITLKIMTGSFVGAVDTHGVILGEERFLQFAVLEFVGVWLAYLVLTIGLLDMTFGMWVWGIRVGYMTKSRKSWAVRKVLRMIFSFIFYAPILPLALLVFKGKKQRNLLDTLSGTVVYQSV